MHMTLVWLYSIRKACEEGEIEVMECLLQYGAQLDIQDNVSDASYNCCHLCMTDYGAT